MRRRFLLAIMISSLCGSACTDTESATNLHSSGPPSIEQVRLDEDFLPAGATAVSNRRVFAFGTFPGVDSEIEHHVTTANPLPSNVRIIMGKLLLGNYLQQVQCNAPVRIDPTTGQPGVWDNVPVGATPDNIAVCATLDPQILQEVCTGPLATCLCQLPNGCNDNGAQIPEGQAVGIYNPNADGTAQSQRFMPDALSLACTSGSGDTVVVPANLTGSYWNPSGFQQAPASCADPPCYDEVGPAIVYIPQTVPLTPPGGNMPPGATAMFPTNMTCGLKFAPDVVDKENNQVCAAPNGRPASCDDINLDQCTADQACTPGDVSAFTFTTEPLTISIEGVPNGATGIDPTTDLFVSANAPLAPGSITSISITEMVAGSNVPYTQYTLSLTDARTIDIHPTAAMGLDQNATYTITFPTTFSDYYNQGLPAPVIVTFTTGT